MKNKTFLRLSSHLWKYKIEDFDFPDYGSFDKRVTYKLSPDQVDCIQEVCSGFRHNHYKNITEFRKALKSRGIFCDD